MIRDGSAQSGLASLNTTFRQGVPQLYADVDRTKVKTLGIPLDSVFATLQAYLGSAYVNDFNRFSRTYQVRVQADSSFRATAEDIMRLDVRNPGGQMVPLATFVDVREILGPQIVSRYNLYPAASINGEAAPGRSSGQALQIIEQMAAAKLPPTDGLRVDGRVLPGEEGRQRGDPDLRPRRRARLPRARRAVRELDESRRGRAGRAARAARAR